MSAVLKSHDPEGRGHELMLTWALFRRGGERDNLPRGVHMGWSEQLDREHVNEPPYVVEIDRILSGLYQSGFEHCVEIAKRFYLAGTPIWIIAPKMRRTEPFVALTLRGICGLVEERITQ